VRSRDMRVHIVFSYAVLHGHLVGVNLGWGGGVRLDGSPPAEGEGWGGSRGGPSALNKFLM